MAVKDVVAMVHRKVLKVKAKEGLWKRDRSCLFKLYHVHAIGNDDSCGYNCVEG